MCSSPTEGVQLGLEDLGEAGPQNLRYLIEVELEHWELALLQTILIELIEEDHQEQGHTVMAARVHIGLEPIQVMGDYLAEHFLKYMRALLHTEVEELTQKY